MIVGDLIHDEIAIVTNFTFLVSMVVLYLNGRKETSKIRNQGKRIFNFFVNIYGFSYLSLKLSSDYINLLIILYLSNFNFFFLEVRDSYIQNKKQDIV